MSNSPRDNIEAWLRYYQDLDIAPFYRDRQPRRVALSDRAALGSERAAKTAQPFAEAEGKQVPTFYQPKAAPPQQPGPIRIEAPAPLLFDSLDRVENDTLEKIRADIGDCRRCRLCEHRTHIVFADGNPKAELVFVGEGPGHDEDVQGVPFVGRAGQLLTQMIEAMGLKRQQVYICNVVKCRPPDNRTPEPNEIATCSPFLVRQLEVIRPKVIVGLGAVAVKTLLASNVSITKIRGQWHEFRGMPLMPTYHPAYLLRNPPAKPDAWKDLQMVMKELGLALPGKK